jgi:hypothetical protein
LPTPSVISVWSLQVLLPQLMLMVLMASDAAANCPEYGMVRHMTCQRTGSAT